MSWLAACNASMNLVSFVCISAAFVAVRRKQIQWHRNLMWVALAASTIFLAGYLTRVALAGVHRFPEVGLLKTFYLGLLAGHSVLAVLALPLILRAVFLALSARIPEHKRIVRYAWPVWMIVSASGVLVYVLLYHVAPRLEG
jgi:putative membrane protein